MKNSLILLFILISISPLWAQINSGEITYKVKLLDETAKASDSIEGLNEDAKSFLEKALAKRDRILPYLHYTLQFNDKESLFTNPENMENDSGIDLNMGYEYVNVFGKYYTNLEEKINLRQFSELSQMILLETELDSLDWEIVEGEKKILGYICKKAKGKLSLAGREPQEITVWFAPEIPFSFGPADIAGLPGLILGFERTSRIYIYADEIQLYENPSSIKRLNKGKQINSEERREMVEKMIQEFKGNR